VLLSGTLFALCIGTAAIIFRQRAGMSDSLRENIGSRRAASELEEDLVNLIPLVKAGVRPEVAAALHDRVFSRLAQIDRYADQDEERVLAAAVRASYTGYRADWDRLPPAGQGRRAAGEALADRLQKDTIIRCQALEEYNNRRIEDSANEHRQGLRFLAWGLVVVGTGGAGAGVLLGYVASRALYRSIRRLQVDVKDAAGKLRRALPEIVVTEEGDLDKLQGQVAGLVGQIEQVVQKLQQREHEVLRAEQLAAVGQLAAGVAHEIRNPLTSIKMLVQAGREAGAPGLPPDDLEVIEREVRRMERSLQTFLDFARPPKPVREPTDLAAVVEHTLGLVRGRAAQQRVGMTFTPPPGGVRYVGDPEQLQQVLVNLVLNALDAMPAGGTLEVRLAAHPDGRAEVAVLDTGTGIADAVAPKLFQPFVSGKETGLGLGLVTSRRIVEDHGGTVGGANRTDGRGAVFTVRLPAPPPAADPR
jgi:signal transduction histidine kinase